MRPQSYLKAWETRGVLATLNRFLVAGPGRV